MAADADRKLEEGEVLPFKIIRILDIPFDEKYFLMQSPGRKKILLPYQTYVNYGIVSGQTLICRVDKVNCTGRVFLEPMHPRYPEGSLFSVTLINVVLKQGKNGREIPCYHATTALGDTICIEISDNPRFIHFPVTVSMHLYRIRKGIFQGKLIPMQE